MSADGLRARIEKLAELAPEEARAAGGRETFQDLLAALEAGRVRACEPDGQGDWTVHRWVKLGILLGFRLGKIVSFDDAGPLRFSDKDTYPVQRIDGPLRSIRVVPGGSSVRAGAFIGDRVTIMPPAYVNVGAYVGEATLIDSHALVGSCAQVGSRVHVSAAAQIGGVLEPVGARPVVIEDDVFLGGNTGVYEGTLVRSRAVIGAGVVLTGSTALYDLVNGVILRGAADRPLEVPANAVVVPGSRPASGDFARSLGVHLSVPVIVKYRDHKSDAKTTLEEALR